MMENRKYYSCELSTQKSKDILADYLKTNKIYYEVSKAFNLWHFEILANLVEASFINDFIDMMRL